MIEAKIFSHKIKELDQRFSFIMIHYIDYYVKNGISYDEIMKELEIYYVYDDDITYSQYKEMVKKNVCIYIQEIYRSHHLFRDTNR